MSKTNIIVSRPTPAVALVTLNRPKVLNALSAALIDELVSALSLLDTDDTTRAIVITGNERAFAAGADIKEMKDKTYVDVFKHKFLENWTLISHVRKPVIAAVSGYALGGGCEIAMACDIVLASPTAVFGLPEIDIGVIPGAGGTQRLVRAIGKSRAMELILSGRRFSATDAAAWGVVSRVSEDVFADAIELATTIAGKGTIAVQAAKEAINVAFETSLDEGLRHERTIFYGLFATQDQKEGMSAFAEKRPPVWSHS
ncbi:predicted protein [Postia placenta Mad-698-R]|nr:predicted protein [Postia placenta Mad-698-R]